MAEIVDDLKISNVEITNELGINFTNDITRIKHTGNDEFNISSSGEINIRTEKKSNGNDCDINLYTGDGQDVDGANEGGDIRLICGDGGVNGGDGGDIEIYAGGGVTGNSDGGYISIYAGDGNDEGGYVEINAGDGNDDNGGYIDIIAGDGFTGSADGGNIYIAAGYGYQSGGDIQLRAGNSNINNETNDYDGGAIEIFGGDSYGENANAGYIDIIAGNDYSSGSGGNLYIQSGNSNNGSAGFLEINGGNGSTNGGAIRIEAGRKNANNATNGANVEIYAGYSDGTGRGGSVIIAAGSSAVSGYGDISISGGPDQKIGFFGNTPVIRPAETGITGGWAQNGGSEVRNESSFNGELGDKLYTIGDIVRALKQLGLLDTYNAAPGVAPASMAALQPRVEKSKKERKEKIDKNVKTE
jgi:hypothetical protein